MERTKDVYKLWVLESIGIDGRDTYSVFDDPVELLHNLRLLRAGKCKVYMWKL